MPQRKVLRTHAVLEATGLSRGTLYRLIADNKFPQPLRLGPRMIGFYEDEIEAWQEARPRGTDSATGRRLRLLRERRQSMRSHHRTPAQHARTRRGA